MVVFGDVIDDVIVTPRGEVRPDTDTRASIERRAGGSAANAAAWFAALGHPVHFSGRVGADDVDRCADALRAAGVTPHLIGEPDLPTGTIVVVLQSDRTRTMLTERGANARTGPHDVDPALLVPGGHLHFTGYSLFDETDAPAVDAFRALTAAAHEHGATVSVNPGSAGFLADHGIDALLAATAGADVLLPNLDEGRMLTGLVEPAEVAAALAARYSVVALTQGRAGVTVATATGTLVHEPAIPVIPVDTTGAGDAFGAAFVSALLASDTPGTSLARATPAQLTAAARAGVAAAARAVTTLGARPAPRASPTEP